MKTQSSDTTPAAEQFLIEGYRKMPAWKKIRCIIDLNQSLRLLQLAEIKHRYPNADDHELRLRLASRWIDPELMRKAFGWDIDEKGY